MFSTLLVVVCGFLAGSRFIWGLPPDEERERVSREVVRILLAEVQVAGVKVEKVKMEVARFAGDGQKGPAVLLGGEGVMKAAGKEDRVLLAADSGSAFAGQWRKLSRGEVMQVPVKLTVQGGTVSGALVVWQRQGQYEGRFVLDEADPASPRELVAQHLAAPQPNLPSSEYIVDFYADPYFTEWVGSFIRLCNGATARDGIQDGFAKLEESHECSSGSLSGQMCWQKTCFDLDGDGIIEPPTEYCESDYHQVECPCSRRPWDAQCLSCPCWPDPVHPERCPWWCQY